MAAHVPTMLAMIIASSLMMAASMAVVGWGRRRDGLGRWAAALLVNAIGHLLIMLRGLIPDLLSIVVGNLMLSSVFVGMIAAVYQFQGRPVRWALLLAPPLLVLVFVSVFIDNFPARVSFVGLVIGLQAVWALLAALSHRHATVGRGQWLLVAGLSLEAVVLGGRALVAISTHSEATNILQSSALQTLTFLATFSVVLVSSVGFVFMSRDRADENNRVLAALDPLTGVANRRSLIAALDRDVARAQRMREPMALMMVDIDHFKDVNDQYGHPAGDRVLCSVVNVLRQRVRAQDLVGRYGGEEFMVLLPDTGLTGAEQLARELCKAVEESRCPADGVPGPGIAVTVSIGVFGGRLESGDSWDMLIAAADRALYQAKNNGRNRVEVATGLRRPSAQLAAQANPETLPESLY
ncbi:diguanylate cyclase (GGDEF)-like protein [Acidovorax delafieldii]|uniref:diguanylate cyclase n=1 Tax=Acidovorax delafieldii TaxID=47920 RepID=A0AAJ2BRW3_ACIDE|nr:GGDEF domain-containing protein [Acidovorax delafieldii]MDR6765043.1 diguanylate cyclase (GGDEF)-like protein [Acidovorax delafieldii]MDR6835480.1 diguanylate cyclase (GGDEF)-like protein [Acidovorax delafieldii]MDR7365550.1 diguanylate cyclase (GGDEF)-like protein [Acidovorax delafieldii]